MTGKIDRTEFGKRLAQEWASFPVLAATKGGSRIVSRGQSFYAGDGLNKSLVTPEAVEAVLDRVKAAASAPATPTPVEPAKPQPTPEQPAKAQSLVAALASLFVRLFKKG